MKRYLTGSAAVLIGLTACNTMNQPISTGAFDPLHTPGTGETRVVAAGPAFTAGQFVSAVMNNTAFFSKRPKGDADADKLLPRGTSMKVISSDESYIRAELDSGEIGWVPVVMVEDPNSASGTNAAFDAGNPNEIQVYPPIGGLPPIEPAGLPPEGAIPTVIEPDAAGPAPLPDVAPPPPEPEPEATGHTPLPDVAAPPPSDGEEKQD